MQDLFFELIRVAIDSQACLSRLPSANEWDEMFVIAKRQSLVCITFIGLQKLGADPSTSSGQVQDEWYIQIGMSEDLYFTWVGVAAKINVQNELVNQQCAVVQRKLSADGFKCCILKGQGVAQFYVEPLQDY